MTKQERLERDIAKLAEMKAHEDELCRLRYHSSKAQFSPESWLQSAPQPSQTIKT
jgi:hypothetical protein